MNSRYTWRYIDYSLFSTPIKKQEKHAYRFTFYTHRSIAPILQVHFLPLYSFVFNLDVTFLNLSREDIFIISRDKRKLLNKNQVRLTSREELLSTMSICGRDCIARIVMQERQGTWQIVQTL